MRGRESVHVYSCNVSRIALLASHMYQRGIQRIRNTFTVIIIITNAKRNKMDKYIHALQTGNETFTRTNENLYPPSNATKMKLTWLHGDKRDITAEKGFHSHPVAHDHISRKRQLCRVDCEWKRDWKSKRTRRRKDVHKNKTKKHFTYLKNKPKKIIRKQNISHI